MTPGEPKKEGEEEKKLPELASFPNVKQRIWIILTKMPDEFRNTDYINYMVEQRYNKQKAANNVSHDIKRLEKLGKIEKIRAGKWKIIDRTIPRGLELTTEEVNKFKDLRNGRSLVMENL